MGEWMTQVPVKLDGETVKQIDALREKFSFPPGRSTVIRELVMEGLRLIAAGVIQFPPRKEEEKGLWANQSGS